VDILDTDILIDVQRGHPPAIEWFSGLIDVPAIPGYVATELIQDARDQKGVQSALKLIAPLPVVWPTATDCEQALADLAVYRLSHGLGLIDSLIAATARGLDASLLTFNAKHYRPLTGILIRQPYVR
jgi:predicted nucleic acid-binding protein